MTDDAARPAAPAPEPDTKDWTWVLDQRCPECGFVAGEVDVRQLPATVRALTARWQAALARSTAAERSRPAVWSVLEYGAHVRDVNRVFAERVRLMRETDDPLFDNWDQDAAAVDGRYAEQDPGAVADELAEAAEAFAAQYALVRPEDLERPGRRSNGSVFTVRTLGRYYLHDVVHHLHDVDA
jgi:DinB superfamily